MTADEFLVVVSRALEIDLSEISLETTMEGLEEWDSLGHLTLLSAIDQATDGKTSRIKGITELASLSDLYAAISR